MPDNLPVEKRWTPHNGWLTYVGYEHNGLGSKTLPPPGPGVKSPQMVDMDVPDLGRVRITYEAWTYRHHKSSNWAWRATWADKIDDQGNVIAPA